MVNFRLTIKILTSFLEKLHIHFDLSNIVLGIFVKDPFIKMVLNCIHYNPFPWKFQINFNIFSHIRPTLLFIVGNQRSVPLFLSPCTQSIYGGITQFVNLWFTYNFNKNRIHYVMHIFMITFYLRQMVREARLFVVSRRRWVLLYPFI